MSGQRQRQRQSPVRVAPGAAHKAMDRKRERERERERNAFSDSTGPSHWRALSSKWPQEGGGHISLLSWGHNLVDAQLVSGYITSVAQ